MNSFHGTKINLQIELFIRSGIFKKKVKFYLQLSTYYGSIFTQSGLKQYIPTIFEQEIGLWGTKLYLQDYESLSEIKTFLDKKRISACLEVVPKSMIRSNSKIFWERDIKKSKAVTIFTHASYWDLIACVLAIFSPINRKNIIPTKKSQKILEIHIRLHPSLKKEIALKEIKILKKSQNLLIINL